MGEPEECRKQILLLNVALYISIKISYTPNPSTEAVIWKDPGSDSVADLREPPGEAEAIGTPARDIDTGSSHFGKLILSQGQYIYSITILIYCQALFWSPSLTYQHWGLTCPPVGWHQPGDPLGPAASTSEPALSHHPRPCSQISWYPVLPTFRLTPAAGPFRTLHSQLSWDLALPTSGPAASDRAW